MNIEKQQELGTNSLGKGDKYLMEINLDSGTYWSATVYGRHDLKGDHVHSRIIPSNKQLSSQYGALGDRLNH